MSNRWPGGLIRKTPVTPTGPFQNGAASGVWTLAEAAFWTKQGLWPIAGNEQLLVEDVFSTWLYTGTGAAQTITNGIDLSTKGGLVWVKSRSNVKSNCLVDTVRGVSRALASNTTGQQDFSSGNYVNAFSTTGFGVGAVGDVGGAAGITFATWTFREAPNFFDVVTYAGNGVSGRAIPHNLGIAPGMIIVKTTNTSGDNWIVYHRSLPTPTNAGLYLNTTDATQNYPFFPTAPDATNFYVGGGGYYNNDGGNTYVAYLFAHVTASDGIIQCGSFTTDGSGNSPQVTLGWEPQWVMFKRTNSATYGVWQIIDTMRGWVNGSAGGADDYTLTANTSDAEGSAADRGFPTATGFNVGYTGAVSSPYIYMAIRRGPMRTPTLGTSVFAPVLQSPQSGGTVRTVGFPADFILGTVRGGGINRLENTKLTGFANTSGASINTPGMFTNTTGAESNQYPLFYNVWNTTARDGDYLYLSNNINYFFQRAPGFFDVVCYTGTGVVRTVTHNLGVAPELMIVKRRDTSGFGWPVYSAPTGAFYFMYLNTTDAKIFADVWKDTSPTSSVFTVGTGTVVNGSGATYVAYLFASAPGVSKVGSYTGNGSSQTINCAFTTGARFVMIKRTDSTGDWYVWDSARGIVAGNDPYLALNDTAAEVTTNDSVDADSTGFVVNQVAASNINVSAATYIFLAIA